MSSGNGTVEKNSRNVEPTRQEQDSDAQRAEYWTSIAGVAGNMLEWYDFSSFGLFSDVIAENFFPPNQRGNSALIESFVVFGSAFLFRPIGGALIGKIGDIHGRKRALELAIFFMAFPTFALGCLPTFSQVGWLSTGLLCLMRIMQGISAGGQIMSSVVFTLERADQSNWGKMGSTVFASATVGTAAGSFFSYALRNTLTDDQLRSWGWRIPFLFGALGVIPGAYLKYGARGHGIESSNGNEGNSSEQQNTIRNVFSKSNRRALLASALVPAVPHATYYIVFIWMAIFMEELIDPPIPHAFAINAAVTVISIGLTLCGGYIADKYGRYDRMLIMSAIALAVLAPICFYLLAQGDPIVAFFAQLTLGMVLSLFNGAMLPWITFNFPPSVRLTSCSIGYNISASICGGFSPFLATVFVDNFTDWSPCFIISFLALVSITGVLIVPKPIQEEDINQISLQNTSKSEGQIEVENESWREIS
eukprot:CAMPEP_0171301082 /NCGR_PEP_ID=MMETSP0816-20121228/10136_1 /TAXON_ID=420281 /ORGANISM="Proboscia inermis, Strain CCAP1064/1" /LENGTH=476 /DNA_ID=CAMNT_0011778285 /DNA_START=5 /DNA_END=1435 /DNA_ORIENTATION=+